MPVLLFLPYVGEGEEEEGEEGEEEEERRVHRPWIGDQGKVTTTGTAGGTSRVTDHRPLGERRR